MLSCKDVAELLAGSDFESLPWTRRMGLRMHAKLCTCHFCHDYARQVTILRAMCRSLTEDHEPAEEETTDHLSPEARDRIASRLRESR